MKNTATRKHLKALEKGFRFFSLMRLHDANDDVFTSYSSDAGRLQHRECLPNARGRPEENLETATYLFSFRLSDAGEKFVRIGPMALDHASRFPRNFEIWLRTDVFSSGVRRGSRF